MTCFRPLSGSYISQCKRKTKGENHEQFPSPIGELHFSIDELIPIARDIQCFRPLSGSYISQYEHGNIKDYMCACFRPLSGSYISQSPEQFCQYISDRFRPLSGSYISQCSESFNPEVITFCFRPLSGSYISQSSTHHSAILHYRFPSPIGELHFSIIHPLFKDLDDQFPSPIGELHFSIDNTEFVNKAATLFPSPIGELHFSIKAGIIRNDISSFRPLSGSYISQ